MDLASGGASRVRLYSGGIVLGSSGQLLWSSTAGADGSADLVLVRDGADTLALKRLANAQTFRVYGTTTGPKYVSLSHNGTDAALAAQAGNLDLAAASGSAVRLSAASLVATDATPGSVSFGTSQNDLAIGVAIWQRFTNSSGGSLNVTGIAGGVSARLIVISNVGAQDIVLQNQNAGSAEANRIITGTGADLTLAPAQTVMLIYDATTTRWRVLKNA